MLIFDGLQEKGNMIRDKDVRFKEKRAIYIYIDGNMSLCKETR